MENVKSSSLKQLEQILAKRERYVVRTDKRERRDLGANPTADNIAEVLATLIKDLKKQGILKQENRDAIRKPIRTRFDESNRV